MYVWQNKDLPPDPDFPVDLKGLGFYINGNDQIRQIANPEEGYKYKVNRNDRFNVRFRESLNGCIRQIIIDRLKKAGLEILRLPLGRNEDESHVPILTTADLAQKSRIIVVIGEPVQDLGVWAYRSIHDGINLGSAVDFTDAVLGDGKNKEVGLVMANAGQLTWHCASQRAISRQTWLATPRPYANWGQATMSWRNKIPSNGDWQQHVQYVFEKVLWPIVQKDTRIDIIGMSEGGLGVIRYLQKDWHVWKPYVSGICLGDPQQTTHTDIDMGTLTDPSSFTSFLASRCRAYLLSSTPLGSRMAGYRLFGCNCYSSGEGLNVECIIPASWRDMLKWLDMLGNDPGYSEHVMLRAEDMDEDMRRGLDEQVEDEKEAEDAEEAKHEEDQAADIQCQQELKVAAEAAQEDKFADLGEQDLNVAVKAPETEIIKSDSEEEKGHSVAEITQIMDELKVTDAAA
ncbi:uncharacterized protein N7503_003045 [Penicillium pulvis]|uniref:uncharacterized protein n=1 Tax=Penicillium pulvis TaxID=1562058 RepID=UPI002546840C|nr:uncharacterized protein N7503_003045 [Penicillium pulvis]KAJ5805443.1 hypothetical protein N7503_003045 [Penicillium pulvis]